MLCMRSKLYEKESLGRLEIFLDGQGGQERKMVVEMANNCHPPQAAQYILAGWIETLASVGSLRTRNATIIALNPDSCQENWPNERSARELVSSDPLPSVVCANTRAVTLQCLSHCASFTKLDCKVLDIKYLPVEGRVPGFAISVSTVEMSLIFGDALLFEHFKWKLSFFSF